MEAKGHTPVVNEDGELNLFVFSTGLHNGPGCATCGWSCCWHCDGTNAITKCPTPASPKRERYSDMAEAINRGKMR